MIAAQAKRADSRATRQADRVGACPANAEPHARKRPGRWRLALLLVLSLGGAAQADNGMAPPLRFDRYQQAHGLSEPDIRALYREPGGFVWAGTREGLFRFDGYRFVRFGGGDSGARELRSTSIMAFADDPQGAFWVGTLAGLYRYRPQHGDFEQIGAGTGAPSGDAWQRVICLLPGTKASLWVGTEGGLAHYDSIARRWRVVAVPTATESGSIAARALTLDGEGGVWAATSLGLVHVGSDGQVRDWHRHRPADRSSLPSDRLTAVWRSADDELWVASEAGLSRGRDGAYREVPIAVDEFSAAPQISVMVGDASGVWVGAYQGLFRYGSDSGTVRRALHDPADPQSLSSNDVNALVLEHDGSLWVGTGDGLNYHDPRRDRFGLQRHEPADPRSLANSNVRSIEVAPDGDVWVGTVRGLHRWRDAGTGFERPAQLPGELRTLGPADIPALHLDSARRLWIGTWGEGLAMFDGRPQRLHRYRAGSDAGGGLLSDRIRSLAGDGSGGLWVGSDRGLNHFDPGSGRWRQYRADPDDANALSHAWISAIHQDGKGRVWLATGGGGLNRLDPGSGRITRYRHDPDAPDGTHSLANDAPRAIVEDAAGMLWIATRGGLNRFDPERGRFQRISSREGLASEFLQGVVLDTQGRVWVSSNAGLSVYHPGSDEVRNYNARDGLQPSNFLANAQARTAKGELLFGGIRGLNRFDPGRIEPDGRPPPVVLTDFLLFNKSIDSLDAQASFRLPAPIWRLSRLELGHRESLLSFEFSALHFANPEGNRYAYRLEGFDSDWIETDWRNRRATYTNLPAGRYTLRVKAANPHGIWNEDGVSLALTVLPPPWRTGWAYGLYALTALGAALLALRLYRRNLGDRLAVASLARVNRIKDEFLANTSHELRTPLNGMVGLAQALLARPDLPESAKPPLQLMIASGRRLANLINDILDFSKLKERSLVLQQRPLDLHALVELVLVLCGSTGASKPVTLRNAVDPALPPVLADENRLQQILLNLVGNACKFTDAGSIEVGVDSRTPLTVYVHDTGIGIAADKQEAIFRHFEQLDAGDTRSHGGTGLGLAITRQLIELHGGRVWVQSQPGQGAVFRFTLPHAFDSAPLAAAPAAESAASDWAQAALQAAERRQFVAAPASAFEPELRHPEGGRFAVLAIDDEAINREVLSGLLSGQPVDLTLAADGVEALELLAQRRFDLVLSDVMMPRLSGYQLCRRIRDRFPPIELPVLLLTAKARLDDLTEGLAAGANDYLSKPIAKAELIGRMQTHLRLAHEHAALQAAVAREREHEKLLVREKLATASQITAGLAHEINNPINFAALAAQNQQEQLQRFRDFLRELAGADAEPEVLAAFDQRFAALDEQLAQIRDGTGRVADIVRDLRAFSKLDPPEPKPTRIAELLAATVRLVGARYRQLIDFEVDLDADPPVRCLPARLNQAFMNLVINACHAVEARAEQEGPDFRGRIAVRSAQREGQLEITIEDNGGGIPETIRERIFEPFFTTKAESKGTGLGLAVSRGIVEEIGGRIDLESRAGLGARFRILLPRDDGRPPE